MLGKVLKIDPPDTPSPAQRDSNMCAHTHPQFSQDQPPTITHHARHTRAMEQWLLTSEPTLLFVRPRHTANARSQSLPPLSRRAEEPEAGTPADAGSCFLEPDTTRAPEKRGKHLFTTLVISPQARRPPGMRSGENGPSAQRQLGPKGIQHRRAYRLRSQQRTKCSEAIWIAAPRGLLHAPPSERHPPDTKTCQSAFSRSGGSKLVRRTDKAWCPPSIGTPGLAREEDILAASALTSLAPASTAPARIAHGRYKIEDALDTIAWYPQSRLAARARLSAAYRRGRTRANTRSNCGASRYWMLHPLMPGASCSSSEARSSGDGDRQRCRRLTTRRRSPPV